MATCPGSWARKPSVFATALLVLRSFPPSLSPAAVLTQKADASEWLLCTNYSLNLAHEGFRHQLAELQGGGGSYLAKEPFGMDRAASSQLS